MEEGHEGPPSNHVAAVGEIGDPTILLTVVLTGGVHPVLHLLECIADLVVAPVTVHEAPEANGHRAEVVLEAGMVTPRGGILVDDDLRPFHV